MSMKNMTSLGTLEGRMLGLEVWCDVDVFNDENSKEPWWEIRKDGVCIKTGSGGDEAPDAAYAEAFHALMEEIHGTEEPEIKARTTQSEWHRKVAEDARRDRLEAMREAGMF